MENEYYGEISFSWSIYSDKIINFSERDLSILSKHFDKIGFTFNETSSGIRFIRINGSYSWIIAIPDEWYVYRRGDRFYLCDQLDGVIKCIEDTYGK